MRGSEESRRPEIAPRSLSFAELLEAAREKAGTAPRADDEEALGDAVLSAYSGNMVELSVTQARFVTDPGERPKASRLARLQEGRCTGGLAA